MVPRRLLIVGVCMLLLGLLAGAWQLGWVLGAVEAVSPEFAVQRSLGANQMVISDVQMGVGDHVDPWGTPWVCAGPSALEQQASWRSQLAAGTRPTFSFAPPPVYSAGPNRVYEGGAGDDVFARAMSLDAYFLLQRMPSKLVFLAILLGWFFVSPLARQPRSRLRQEAISVVMLAALPCAVNPTSGFEAFFPSLPSLVVSPGVALRGTMVVVWVLIACGVRLRAPAPQDQPESVDRLDREQELAGVGQ